MLIVSPSVNRREYKGASQARYHGEGGVWGRCDRVRCRAGSDGGTLNLLIERGMDGKSGKGYKRGVA